jgi:hypothetical protein
MIYDFDFRFIIHKSKIITFVSDYKNRNQNPYFFILNF